MEQQRLLQGQDARQEQEDPEAVQAPAEKKIEFVKPLDKGADLATKDPLFCKFPLNTSALQFLLEKGILAKIKEQQVKAMQPTPFDEASSVA